MLFTGYFTGLPDPQGRGRLPRNCGNKISPLIGDVRRHEINTVIFHDELSDEFTQQWSCKHVAFVKVPISPSHSVNDYRFFCIRNWLRQQFCESAWYCDLFDVRINIHPDEMLRKFPSHNLFIGIESSELKNNSKTSSGIWMCNKYEAVYGEVPQKVVDKTILTSGLFGGTCSSVLRFTEAICDEITKRDSNPMNRKNANMVVVNKVAYCDLPEEDFWADGFPFNSVFKKFDYSADVVFVHK